MTATEKNEMSTENKEIQQVERLKVEDCAPDSDGVNLQCINSTDFVVGKQTTFNGPVTIINYEEGSKEKVEEKYKPSREEIVIREKIITPSSLSEMQAFAEKNSDGKFSVEEDENRKIAFSKRILKAKLLKIPIVLWILLFVVIVVGCAVFFIQNSETEVVGGVDTGEENSRKPRTITYNGKKYNYISREDWNARVSLATLDMKLPVRYVVISHTATRFCYLKATCITLVRDIQGDHMNRSPPLADIAYSFLVGGDGNIYEGRGWTKRTSVMGFANGKNIDINFIGSFENLDPPTSPQTEAVKALIEYGLNNTYIDPNYSLIAANSTHSTLSPGIQVYKEIKTWPHFDPNPEENVDE